MNGFVVVFFMSTYEYTGYVSSTDMVFLIYLQDVNMFMVLTIFLIKDMQIELSLNCHCDNLNSSRSVIGEIEVRFPTDSYYWR